MDEGAHRRTRRYFRVSNPDFGHFSQDEGGGIPLDRMHKVWQYSFTTVCKKSDSQESKDGGTGLYMVLPGALTTGLILIYKNK